MPLKRPNQIIHVFSLLIATVGGNATAQNSAATATIYLTVPAITPVDSAVWIAANLLSPAWRPNGQKMQRQPDGRYVVKVSLAPGSNLEYKFTRGSWATVEKTNAGADIPNRRLRIDRDTTIADTVRLWGRGAPAAAIPSTRAGTIKTHPDVGSKSLTNSRTVLVYLPPGYDASTARYPVLYMHDGQNLFDRATGFGGQEWEMDETAERLIRAGQIQPLIIVGIYNTGARMTEYTPVAGDTARGRNGDDYARFLVEELKPFIDRTYRTRPEREATAVAGSSLGGIISLSIALHYPNVVGKIGVVSPSLFWNNEQPLREAAAGIATLKRERIWLDIGTNEGGFAPGDSVTSTVRNARRLAEVLRTGGLVSGRDYFYLEVPGGEHNERSWAQRMDKMLTFLFPK